MLFEFNWIWLTAFTLQCTNCDCVQCCKTSSIRTELFTLDVLDSFTLCSLVTNSPVIGWIIIRFRQTFASFFIDIQFESFHHHIMKWMSDNSKWHSQAIQTLYLNYYNVFWSFFIHCFFSSFIYCCVRCITVSHSCQHTCRLLLISYCVLLSPRMRSWTQLPGVWDWLLCLPPLKAMAHSLAAPRDQTHYVSIYCTLTDHFIRHTLLVQSWTFFCLQNWHPKLKLSIRPLGVSVFVSLPMAHSQNHL